MISLHYVLKTTGLGVASFMLFVLDVTIVYADHQVFDVTHFCAMPERKDNGKAFLAAWIEACKFKGNATFLVPEGTFVLGPVKFKGPCENGISPAVKIKGTLKALPETEDFPDKFLIMFSDLNMLSLSGGGTLDGQGHLSWEKNSCRNNRSCKFHATTLKFYKVRNSEVYELNLMNSKAFHMNIHRSNHIDVHHLNVTAPGDSPNTDGIHVGITNHINISDSIIATGDDCISIGPGSRSVFISNVTCGPGHGISVGSLGKYENEEDVIDVLVKNSTIMHTTNGLRIKTWPGSAASKASNLTFQDIHMINVSNPIIIDQKYCPVDNCTNQPSNVEVSNVKYQGISGTSSTKLAVNLLCSENVPCKKIILTDIKLVCSNVCSNDNCHTTSSCSNVHGSSSGTQIPSSCL